MAANNAVVGILRAMLTADTAQFDTGMRKAGDTLKTVANNTGKVGAELAKITPQAERMVKSFQGDKLLYTANNLVTAITKVGGATKLTEAEQARANRTLTDAIAKYALLGQKAPQSMVDLEQATRKVEPATSFLTTKMVALGAAVGTFVANLAFQGVRSLVTFGKEAFSTAGHLVDLRAKTGESLESLQRMQFVAVQTGSSFEAMANAAFMLRTRLASGGDSVAAALKDVATQSGVTGLTTRSSADQILTALSSIKDEQERLRLGTALFGRGFKEMAASVTDGYAQIARGAKVSTDEQIEALSDAGDAWDAWWENRKANLRSFLGTLVLLPDAIASMAVPDELGMVNAELAKSVKERKAYTVETIKVAKAEATYAEQLKAAQRELIKVSAAEREELNAMRTMGVETDKIVDALIKFGVNASSAETALKLLNGQTRESAKVTKGASTELEEMYKWVAKLNGDFANQQGMAWFNHDAEVIRMNTVTGDYLAILEKIQKVSNDIAEPPLASGRAPGSGGLTMAPGLGQRRVQEQRDVWTALTEGATRSLQLMDTAIAGSFAQMAIGAKGFKEGFIDIWKSIKHSIINIMADVLSYFTKQFLGGLIKGLVGARLGQSIGTAITGGVTSAALSGGAIAGTAGGVGAGGTAAGVGAGIGVGTTMALTGGAAGAALLGWAIWKKGLFRGGEESLQVNPRRDQFTAQFGGSDNLAAKLTQITGQPGGGALHAAMRSADTVSAWERAQAAIVGALAGAGMRGVKSFALGGFVPPGVVQPAVMHGGAFGEDIIPRTSATGSAGGRSVTLNVSIKAWDGEDVTRVFRSEIIPRLKRALELNTDDMRVATMKAATT